MQKIVDSFDIHYTERTGSGGVYSEQKKTINELKKSINDITEAQNEYNSKTQQTEKQFAYLGNGAKTAKDKIDQLEEKLAAAKLMPGGTDAQIAKRNQAIKAIEDEISRLNKLGLPDKKAEKAAETAANKAQRAAEKVNTQKAEADARKKQIEESREKLRDAVQQTELELSQVKIDGMKDGFEKQQAQIDLDTQKRKLDIEAKAKELIKAQQDIEEKQWENDNPNWKKQRLTFTPTTTDESGLSTDAQNELSNLRAKSNQETLNANQKLLNDLLSQAQDYQAKRVNIEAQYNDKIAALESLRTTSNADIIDRGINELTKKYKESLSSMDFDEFKNSINWEDVFGNLNELSTKTLKDLKGKLEKYISDPLNNLSPENIKVVKEQIDKINDLVGTRNPFAGFVDGIKQISSNNAEIEETTKQIELLEASYEDLLEKSKGEPSGGMASTLVEQLKNQIDELQKKIAELQGKNKKTWSEMAKDLSKVSGIISATASGLSEISESISNTGENTKSDFDNIIDGLQGIASTGQGVAQLMNGDIAGGIQSIVSGVSKMISSIDGLFFNATENYEKLKTTLEGYVDVLEKVINKQKELLEDTGGSVAVSAYETAKSAIESEIASYRKLAASAGSAGAGLFSHSNAYKTNKALSPYWEDISKSAGVTVDSIDDLYSLTADQLEAIMIDNSYAWSLIDDDIQTYLEDIIDAQDELDDLTDSVNEALTGISFDSVKDGLDDLLQDTSTTMFDIADNFEDMMRNSILKFVKDQYLTKALEDWYAKYAAYAASDDKLMDAEVEELQTLYENIYSDAQSMYDSMLSSAGLSASSSDQSSTTVSSSSVDQETADEINGRMTAIQIAEESQLAEDEKQTLLLESIESKLGDEVTSINSVSSIPEYSDLLTINSDIRNIADENRTLLAQSYLELIEIRNNTGDSVKYLKSIQSDISEVKKNTKALSSK